jgi:membrane protein insertase Oxa1/YidC/SpoIIIJ
MLRLLKITSVFYLGFICFGAAVPIELNPELHTIKSSKTTMSQLQKMAELSAELRRLETKGKSDTDQAKALKQQLDKLCKQLTPVS